jgi:hypothetical protein
MSDEITRFGPDGRTDEFGDYVTYLAYQRLASRLEAAQKAIKERDQLCADYLRAHADMLSRLGEASALLRRLFDWHIQVEGGGFVPQGLARDLEQWHFPVERGTP